MMDVLEIEFITDWRVVLRGCMDNIVRLLDPLDNLKSNAVGWCQLENTWTEQPAFLIL